MKRFFLAAVAVALAATCAATAEVEIVTPRDRLLTTEDTLVVIGRAQRGQRLQWSVYSEGITRSDTVTADWGNLFEIFVLLDPGLNRVRVEDSSIEVFFAPDARKHPEGFRPQFAHAADLARCEDCHDPRHVELVAGGYPWVCLGCHLVVSSNPDFVGEARDDPHFRVAVADCGRCHEPHLSVDPQLLRAPTASLCAECHPQYVASPSTHQAMAEGACSACHDPHFSGYPASLLQPQPGLCQRCHDQGLEAGEPHPPLAGGRSCSTCHAPHGSGAKLLVETAESLCTRCHREVAGRGHQTLLEKCDTCHDPHGIREKGMLHRDAVGTCLGCHEGVGLGVTRHPAIREGCRACHQPHADDDLVQARRACTACHAASDDREFASLHGNLSLTSESCNTCHPPHASPMQRLVNGNLHQPLAQSQCSACHGGGEDRSIVVSEPASRCRMCHDFEKTLRSGGARLHQPVGDGACIACHDPHMSIRPNLLRQDEATLCRSCHQVSAPGEGRALHPPAATCTGCHAPHGGANPGFLSATGAAVCLACHDASHCELTELHPSLEGTCTPCHDPHAGISPGLQRGTPESTPCENCHTVPKPNSGSHIPLLPPAAR